MPTKFEIGEDISKSFDRYAALFNSSTEEFIQQALTEKLEDLEDLRIAKERLENPNAEYINLEDL